MNESTLRRRAAKLGWQIKKTRAGHSFDNFGGYMITDAYTNVILWGSRFELELQDLYEIVEANAK